jgi:hypothetical protein
MVDWDNSNRKTKEQKEKRRKSESDQTVLEKEFWSKEKEEAFPSRKSSAEEGRSFEQPAAEGPEESEFGIACNE